MFFEFFCIEEFMNFKKIAILALSILTCATAGAAQKINNVTTFELEGKIKLSPELQPSSFPITDTSSFMSVGIGSSSNFNLTQSPMMKGLDNEF